MVIDMSEDVFQIIIVFLSMFYYLMGLIIFAVKYEKSYNTDKKLMFNKKQTIITISYFLIGFVFFYFLGGVATIFLPITLIPLSILIFLWFNKVNFRIRMLVLFTILFLFFFSGLVMNLRKFKYLEHDASNIFGLIILALMTAFWGYGVYYYIAKKDVTVEKDVYYDEDDNEKKNNNKKTK